MFKRKQLFLLIVAAMIYAVIFTRSAASQIYTIRHELPATSVKNQYQSSTCWCFATISFLESELIRTGRGQFDLSEIFVIRDTYIRKAEKYIRLHGKMSFTGGGEPNDVTETINTAGIMPESVYPGTGFHIEAFNFAEFDNTVLSFVNDIVDTDAEIDTAWRDSLERLLDKFLGPVPESFQWDGKEYTPQTFALSLGLDMDDYIMFGSYTHHPYYSKFILEVPDNWSWGYIFNITPDEMINLMDSSIIKGYSIVWASDYSEDGFKYRSGYATLTDPAEINAMAADQVLLRQKQFDNYDTQDDHGMHITGIAYNNEGLKHYLVKNSWGSNNIYDGYFYASEPYVRLKTISVMVNRNVLDNELKQKLNIK